MKQGPGIHPERRRCSGNSIRMIRQTQQSDGVVGRFISIESRGPLMAQNLLWTQAIVPTFLTDFRSLHPVCLSTQAETLAWLASAHARAEATQARKEGRIFEETRFREHMVTRLARFGCGQDKIASRAHELADCSNTRWSDMRIYRLDDQPAGVGALARTKYFTQTVEAVFNRLYSNRETPPSDLLHVTCTGYDSPSAAQRLVAAKGWGANTRVLHVYHMGCYAAFPALRVAGALAADSRHHGSGPYRPIDVVHTEICSLHLNPLDHAPEQLVVQTLFADGFIAYGVVDQAAWSQRSPALELRAQAEQILPGTAEAMTWSCSEGGMEMALSREVPERIAGTLSAFVDGMAKRAGIGDEELSGAVYAVHPGGPKILDRAREVLHLDETQIACSRKVLLQRGNMSSATLPHIWMDLVRDPDIAPGRTIVSLAFGPGLTICGAVMRKVA